MAFVCLTSQSQTLSQINCRSILQTTKCKTVSLPIQPCILSIIVIELWSIDRGELAINIYKLINYIIYTKQTKVFMEWACIEDYQEKGWQVASGLMFKKIYLRLFDSSLQVGLNDIFLSELLSLKMIFVSLLLTCVCLCSYSERRGSAWKSETNRLIHPDPFWPDVCLWHCGNEQDRFVLGNWRWPVT